MSNSKLGLIIILFVLLAMISACTSNSDQDEIAVGNPAPEFSLVSSDGEQVMLSEFKGQPVLLFFHMAGG